jgi:hypothetical protein
VLHIAPAACAPGRRSSEGGSRRYFTASRGAGDPDESSEELELEREMEYFVEPEEAFTRDEIE